MTVINQRLVASHALKVELRLLQRQPQQLLSLQTPSNSCRKM
jgi:hypothetical protein